MLKVFEELNKLYESKLPAAESEDIKKKVITTLNKLSTGFIFETESDEYCEEESGQIIVPVTGHPRQDELSVVAKSSEGWLLDTDGTLLDASDATREIPLKDIRAAIESTLNLSKILEKDSERINDYKLSNIEIVDWDIDFSEYEVTETHEEKNYKSDFDPSSPYGYYEREAGELEYADEVVFTATEEDVVYFNVILVK